MKIDDLLETLNLARFMPGWSHDVTRSDQYEDTAVVTIRWEACNSRNPVNEPGDPMTLERSFYLQTGDCHTINEVWARLLTLFLLVQEHEAREFFRVPAPPGLDSVSELFPVFDPHTTWGQRRWSDYNNTPVGRDLYFGHAFKPAERAS